MEGCLLEFDTKNEKNITLEKSKLNDIEELIEKWNTQTNVIYRSLMKYLKGSNSEINEIVEFENKLVREVKILEDKFKWNTGNEAIIKEINNFIIKTIVEINDKIEEFGFSGEGKLIRAQTYSILSNMFIEIFSYYETYMKEVAKTFRIKYKQYKIGKLSELIYDEFLIQKLDEEVVGKWKFKFDKIRIIRNSLNHNRESVTNEYKFKIINKDIFLISENIKEFLVLSRECIYKKELSGE